MRGDVYLLRPRDSAGSEQKHPRPCVEIGNNGLLGLDTRIVLPTSTSAPSTSFRVPIMLGGRRTSILCDQIRCTSVTLLDNATVIRQLTVDELDAVADALRLTLSIESPTW